MDDEIPLEDVAEEIDEAKQLREAEEQIRELQQSGWVWRYDGSTKLLAHPDDPDVNIWFHPYSGEQLLSPTGMEWFAWKSTNRAASLYRGRKMCSALPGSHRTLPL